MLTVSLLTPLIIEIDNQPLKLPSRRTEALFIYLIRNRQIHTREELAHLLWDDLPQSKALGNLRVLLANLRKSVAPYFTITRQSVTFHSESAYHIDSTILEGLLTVARREIDDQGALTKATATKLGTALQQYRGDLLPGFYLRNAQGFEEWLATEREWLWTRVVEAVTDLATEYLQWGEYRAGIEQAQRLVNLDPLREEGHQLLMQLWAAEGQISAALAQYERCVQILDAEMGLPPHPFTRELQARIRAGTWQLPSRSAIPVTEAIPHNLPRPIAQLLGREVELEQLLALLETPTAPLITVAGAGGMGKTALAIEAAWHLYDRATAAPTATEERARWQDGIYHISLAPLQNVAGIVPAIAAATGYLFQKNEGDETTQLLHHLRNKSMLLLLDNAEHLAEHLVDKSDLWHEILTAAPQVKLLITSRHKLNVPGETVLTLTGLDYPKEEIVPDGREDHFVTEVLLAYNAVRLFIESVRRAHGNVELSDLDMQAVAQICRLAEGMPLAILLAASWVELLSPTEIADAIAADVAFLRTEADQPAHQPSNETHPRQQSMHAIFNHSWALLTHAEQQCFARMSIFRGGCTRMVAQQVTGASLRELLSLVHKSLLVRDLATGRFTIHELLRQLAAEKLHEMGQPAAQLHQLAVETLERHEDQQSATHYGEIADHAEQAGLLSKARSYLQRAGEVAAAHYQNNLALSQYDRALHLTPPQELETAFQLRQERVAILHLLGRREEQREELAQLDRLAQLLEDPKRQSEVLIGRARYAEAVGRYAEAAEAAEQAVALATEVAATDLLALGYLAWGVALGRDSVFAAARECLEQAVQYAEAADLPLVAADSLRNLGIDAAYQDQYELAKGYFEQNLAIYQRLQNRPGEAAGLGNLGALAVRQCDFQGAQPYMEQSMAIFRQIGDLRSETIGLNNLGLIAHKLERYDTAQVYFEQALHLTDLTDDQQSRREAHNLLGHLFIDQGKLAEACTHYRAAHQLAQQINSPGHVVESQVGLALIAFNEGDGQHALALLRVVLDDLEAPLLAQVEDRVRLYWGAYQILAANQDEQAQALLQIAHHHLQQQAAQQSDAAKRRSFLQRSPMHRAIEAAFAARAGSKQ